MKKGSSRPVGDVEGGCLSLFMHHQRVCVVTKRRQAEMLKAEGICNDPSFSLGRVVTAEGENNSREAEHAGPHCWGSPRA